jgi:DNA-binding transcriptional LysR family regulator
MALPSLLISSLDLGSLGRTGDPCTPIRAIVHHVNWDDLRVFVAVARTARISVAARELGVEHTTVGRRLAALERDLGVSLFHRTAGGYRLTPHGERALRSALAMEQAALAVGARAREETEVQSGRVRVAMLDELAAHWLAYHLPALRVRHPGLELELLTGIMPLDLSRGEADLAVRTPRPRKAGLAAVRLGRTAMALYASNRLLAGEPMYVVDTASLRGHALLVFTSPYRALQSASWLQPVLREAPIAMRANSTHALLGAARAGAGIAVLPRIVARRYADLVSVSDDLHVGEHWLVTHPELRRDPKVRAIADFLKQAAIGQDGLV